MFKKIVVLMSALVILVGGIFSTSFQSNATGIQRPSMCNFTVNYARPAIGENQGYINLYMTNDSGAEYVVTLFWTTMNVLEHDGSFQQSVAWLSVYDSSLKFNQIGYAPDISSAYYSLFIFHSNGVLSQLTSSYTESYTQYFDGTIMGWQAYGNIFVDDLRSFGNNSFNVFYSEDASAILLSDVLELLKYDRISDINIHNAVSGILNSVDGLENQLVSVINYLKSVDDKLSDIKDELQEIYDKADEILQEEKKQTSWLEKIFNYLNESQEKQKQEAQTQGNNSTSQGMNAIEDKGSGFASSLGGLTNSMSYAGTQCAWEFPEVKIPAIPGVMDEMVLIKKQPIDFSVWVNAIPSDILLVVQSLCTVGLIIYCFKELYNTIAYVLTLRKDDNS